MKFTSAVVVGLAAAPAVNALPRALLGGLFGNFGSLGSVVPTSVIPTTPTVVVPATVTSPGVVLASAVTVVQCYQIAFQACQQFVLTGQQCADLASKCKNLDCSTPASTVAYSGLLSSLHLYVANLANLNNLLSGILGPNTLSANPITNGLVSNIISVGGSGGLVSGSGATGNIGSILPVGSVI